MMMSTWSTASPGGRNAHPAAGSKSRLAAITHTAGRPIRPLGPTIRSIRRRGCHEGRDESGQLGAQVERVVDGLPRVLLGQSQLHWAAGR